MSTFVRSSNGKVIYTGNDNDDNPIVIEDINYDPPVECVYIKSGENKYKLHMNQNFDFDYSQLTKIKPNQKRIKGKRNR